jgi:hypothetical protein
MKIATTKEEMVAAIEDLIRNFENGEVTSAALRVFNADGTWEDISLGDTEEERAAALAALKAAQDGAH